MDKNIDVLKIDTFDIKNKFFSARRALNLNIMIMVEIFQ